MRLYPILHTGDLWSHCQLFTLRVCVERLDAKHRDVRMQVRYVLSGEARSLRDWAAVTAYMMSNRDSLNSDV